MQMTGMHLAYAATRGTAKRLASFFNSTNPEDIRNITTHSFPSIIDF
jgi:hypothetical protein